MSNQSTEALKAQKVLTEEDVHRLLEVLLKSARPRRMTYEEFLAWADEDTLAEWVDGEVVTYTPASYRHQDLADFLVSVLRSFVEARGLGVVLSAPFQMKLEKTGREPDLLFVAKAHLDRLKATHLEGPADLVVEIASPESMARDRGEKFVEYERGGVPEYWLIDPQAKRAEFYVRGEEGSYTLVLQGGKGVYQSRMVPGFWLRVEWLWAEPLPSPVRVVAEVAGLEATLLEALERALRGEEG